MGKKGKKKNKKQINKKDLKKVSGGAYLALMSSNDVGNISAAVDFGGISGGASSSTLGF